MEILLMKLSGKTFDLSTDAIDLAGIQHIPLEGTIIPLSIDNIEGMRRQLYPHQIPELDRAIKSVYLYLCDETFKTVFSIEYADGDFNCNPYVKLDPSEFQMVMEVVKSSASWRLSA